MRVPHLQKWVQQVQPDIILLQELKCEAAAFPHLDIEAMGYRAEVVGQKAYNGVAVLSRIPVTVSRTSLPGDPEDSQARYIEVVADGITIASIYLPNGNPVDTEKYPYKLKWMARLEAHARTLLATEKPLIFGGDFNIIPTEHDVYDPKGWEHDALFRTESRAAWRRLLHLGLTDAFHALHPDKKHAYTFWDYQQSAWQRDWGLRIDHFLLSPETTDRLKDCHIDRTPRGWEKASDHTPVVLDIT